MSRLTLDHFTKDHARPLAIGCDCPHETSRVPSRAHYDMLMDVVRWQGTDANAGRGERASVRFGSKFTVRFTVHFAIRPHGWNGFARRYGLAAKTAKSLPDS